MGAFIRSQREMANMSLRQLAQATQVSNAYLSQIERGLHDPTVRVLVQIGQALHLSLEDMLSRESSRDDPQGASPGPDVEAAVRSDSRLSGAEKEALLAVYRSYVATHEGGPSAPAAARPAAKRAVASRTRPRAGATAESPSDRTTAIDPDLSTPVADRPIAVADDEAPPLDAAPARRRRARGIPAAHPAPEGSR
jgi:transcriptional regulator with XRE-family HTH domain